MSTSIPLIASFLLLTSFAFVEPVKEFYPEVLSKPDLRPDTLRKYEALTAEFNRLIEEDVPYDNWPENLRVMEEGDLALGPYSTEIYGCGWYCGGFPDRMSATSQLDSNATATYIPENIHDFDLQTAWIEGKEGMGVGEEIHITFKFPSSSRRVTHVEIYNGYCKSEKAWQENARVKKFGLYANGEFVGRLNLEDIYKGQRFAVGSLGGDNEDVLVLTFGILEVYPGTKYPDTAVSEINVDGIGHH